VTALIVEDEPHIRELVCLHLGLEGFACTQADDGHDAIRLVSSQRFDLIVLDLMIPHVDGLAVCRSARRSGANVDTPILMLTARREESDKVLGLESGADDYLTKPFGVRELVARVHALMRRARSSAAAVTPAHAAEGGQAARTPDAPPAIRIAGLDIDPARRVVRVQGVPADLTAQEFNLLYVLASHAGIVFSREALLARVWKGEAYVTVRSVDALVKRLRKKIEPDPSSPRFILTVWGAGYKFADV
jgi:DNA-binding response OmpR family regulator